MANANQDLLGVGQVVKKEGEEDVIRISAKKLRNYLIIAGSILVLVSAVICFAFLGKDKDVAGVANENAASQTVASGTESDVEIVKSSEGPITSLGNLSEEDIRYVARDCSIAVIKDAAYENEHTLNPEKVIVNYDITKAQHVGTERAADNGAKIYAVKFRVVGTYYSGIVFATRQFAVTFTRYIMREGDDLRYFGAGYADFRTWS